MSSPIDGLQPGRGWHTPFPRLSIWRKSMKTGKFNFKKLVVLGGTSVFTLLAVPLVADLAFDGSRALLATAHAADGVPAGSGQGGASGGAQQGQGGSSSGAGRTTDAAGAGQAGGTSGGAQQGQGASTSGGTSGSSAKGQGGASGGASKATDGAATSGTGSMGSGARGQGSSQDNKQQGGGSAPGPGGINNEPNDAKGLPTKLPVPAPPRSEEHTSEL